MYQDFLPDTRHKAQAIKEKLERLLHQSTCFLTDTIYRYNKKATIIRKMGIVLSSYCVIGIIPTPAARAE